ncbi:hypothetical protein BJ085DRAFT_40565 [Dimargaris cristalligena]|uniref:Transmembrane protein n=1 Tax=Dimargaris cristalligena TaxID=215637 RepID=A0A4P9ZJ20_9FUNG|nr:hypothetical protein BJ085DRAFT_40565 [Dimargaris cristalligena]|eukprot:RKP33197.1 hypothetical protein BJ085DRAFT_40565 [Dimargaris cristalligena]
MSQTRFTCCRSAVLVHRLALANALLFVVDPIVSLLLLSLSGSTLVLIGGLLTFAVILAAFVGLRRNNSLLLRPLVVLLLVNSYATFLAFLAAVFLATQTRAQLSICRAVTESEVLLFPSDVCMTQFWKVAFLFLTTLGMVTAFKLYSTSLLLTVYRQLRDGQAGAPNDSREAYAAVAMKEDIEKV